MTSLRFVLPLCLLSLLLIVPIQAQETSAPSLHDAKTFAAVFAYLQQEIPKLELEKLAEKERSQAIAGLLMPVSDKMLEVASNPAEKQQGYGMKFSALANLMMAGTEGAEQKMDTYIKELGAKEETQERAETFQLQYLLLLTRHKGFKESEQKFESFLKELAAKEKNTGRNTMLLHGGFFLFSERAKAAEVSAENFAKFKTELKTWIDREGADSIFDDIVSLGFEVAYKNKVAAEQIVKELSEYILSPQCKFPATEKKEAIAEMEKMLRLAPGVDPKLYGKTLSDEDFKWESLRGKYVLIKFTATWCGPCKMQIPGMLEAYAKYKDKGLEIVSVYVWEREEDAVASIKETVEEEKLPWLILAEALTEKSGKPAYGEFYGFNGVPTMVLVDKEGKIMLPATHGDEWKKKLEEIFGM